MPSSSSSHRRSFTSLALVLAAFVGTACGSSSSDGASSPAPARPGDDAAKAPPVNGTPDASEITEAFGVFVAPNGRADNAGTRERPLASIQAGIDLGKRTAKRVYVCSGTFREALVLADSISIIGGLDCGLSTWKLGAAPTRVEAPSSPAVRAKDIASATRIEGLDIFAPHATQPSGSSIGLLADHAKGLVIASSKITAGDGANGTDGAEGIQLVQSASARGGNAARAAICSHPDTCSFVLGSWVKPRSGYAGTSTCAGAPGHDGLPGGEGGSGGLFVSTGGSWDYYFSGLPTDKNAPSYGEARAGTAGADGAIGTPGSALGALSADGYAAADGVPGTNGAPGNGGRGGRGGNPLLSAGVAAPDAWRGEGGDGGGAGGCPGLAGAAGTGGGASIALALIDSPVVVDGTQLIAGKAGTAGRGTFGSDPTLGGAAGTPWSADPVFTGRPGGQGGLAGISTNGGNGPSAAVLYSGAAPSIRGGAKLLPGKGGAAIDTRSRSDAFGNIRTIAATPAGISKDILAL